MTALIIALINAVGSMVSFFMPDISIANDVVVNISSVVDMAIDILNKVNFMIPLNDIFMIIGLDITLRVVMLIAFGANLVIRRVFDVIP